jgi:hypothetical protein
MFSVDQLTRSENFDNLLASNSTLLPKENLFPMTFYTSLQIYKNNGGQQVFFSRVTTKLINLVPRLGKVFLQFLLND